MRERLRLVLLGIGTGLGCTALAALVSLIPAGWSPGRFELYMLALSILSLTMGLASLVASGALGLWLRRNQPSEPLQEKGETAWLVVSTAATVFVLWLLLG